MFVQIPAAVMNVIEEKSLKDTRKVNMCFLLFVTSAYQLLTVWLLFLVDIIPSFGFVKSLPEFGNKWVRFNTREEKQNKPVNKTKKTKKVANYLIHWYIELKSHGGAWLYIPPFSCSYKFALQCFFGGAGCSSQPGLSGTSFIVLYLVSYPGGGLLMRDAEGATYLAVVQVCSQDNESYPFSF